MSALGGLDMLVFTAGIGERAGEIRAQIGDRLEHLGVLIDPKRNDADEELISDPESRVTVRVVATNENLMIARHARAALLERSG